MPRRLGVVFGLLTSFVHMACLAQVVRGSGRTARDAREVGSFDGVAVAQGIRATVEAGSRGPVEIEADDNLLPLIETRVEGGKLEIRFAENVRVRDGGDVRVRVRAPEIRYLGASGGSDIRAELRPAEQLEVEASGGSEVHARGIEVAELSAHGSGGSRLELQGRSRKVSLEMSGGTRIKAAKLETQTVRVNGSGGSHAEVAASDTLRGALSGGSDVRLRGKAQSRVSTSGGSSVDFDD